MTSVNKAAKKKNLSLILGFAFAISLVATLCVMTCNGQLLPLILPLPPEILPETADFHYIQHLSSPDGKHIFALFADNTALVGDTGWYIFKFEQGFDVKNYQVSWKEYTNGDYLKNKIMSNYAEGGGLTKNPQIEIIGGKYLVFMRGGLYHSLYDIEAGKTLVEVYSPWHKWIDSEEYQSVTPDPNSEEYQKSFEEWTRENLHEPILRIIQSQ